MPRIGFNQLPAAQRIGLQLQRTALTASAAAPCPLPGQYHYPVVARCSLSAASPCWAARLRRSPKTGHTICGPTLRKVVGGLEIQPELGGRIEGLSEKPRGLGRHTATPPDEFIDALQRNTEVLSQSNLGLSERSEEFFEQNLTRMRRNPDAGLHCYPLW